MFFKEQINKLGYRLFMFMFTLLAIKVKTLIFGGILMKKLLRRLNLYQKSKELCFKFEKEFIN